MCWLIRFDKNRIGCYLEKMGIVFDVESLVCGEVRENNEYMFF